MNETEQVDTAIVDELEGLKARVRRNGQWYEGTVEIVECGREGHPKVGEEVSLYHNRNRPVLTVSALHLNKPVPYRLSDDVGYSKSELMEYRCMGVHKVLRIDDQRIWPKEVVNGEYEKKGF